MIKKNCLIFMIFIVLFLLVEKPGLARSPRTPAASDEYWLTLILDKSGSMLPIESEVRRSVYLVVDLIAHYNTIYPQRDLNLLVLYFTDTADIVYTGKAKTLDHFRRQKRAVYKVRNNDGTNFNAAVSAALERLKSLNVRPERNTTLFITDGIDGGKPDKTDPLLSSEGSRLGTVWFIYLRSPNAKSGEIPEDLKAWAGCSDIKTDSIIKSASDLPVSVIRSASDLLPILLMPLWDFYFRDMSSKLVRYTEDKLIKGTLSFHKHSPAGRVLHQGIISRPGNAAIETIIREDGTALTEGEDYELTRKETFFGLKINPHVPEGEYIIRFSDFRVGSEVTYINFEDIGISLKVSLAPERNHIYPKKSPISFMFRFWDTKNNLPVTYPDFLDLIHFRYEIHHQGKPIDGVSLISGGDSPTSTASHLFNQEGDYSICTAWHYLPALLPRQPCEDAASFTIQGEMDYLLSLDYAEGPHWEGRDLPISVRLTPLTKGTPIQFTEILVNAAIQEKGKTGKTQELRFAAPRFESRISPLSSGHYQLLYKSASPDEYSEKISMEKDYRFESRKRKLRYSRELMTETLTEKQLGGGLLGKIKKVWISVGSVFRDLKVETLKDEDAYQSDYPILVKFSGSQDAELTCRVGFNRLFEEDEKGVVRVTASQNQVKSNFDIQGAPETFLSLIFNGIKGLFGVEPAREKIADAVILEYDLPEKPIQLSRESDTVSFKIRLKKQACWINEKAFPIHAPGLIMEGRIERYDKTGNQIGQTELQEVRFDMRIEAASGFGAYAWSALVTVLLIALILLILLILIMVYSYYFYIKAQKMRLWKKEIIYYYPADFYSRLPRKYQSRFNGPEGFRDETTEMVNDLKFRRLSRKTRSGLWTRFAKSLPLKDTRRLARLCRTPNIPSTWEFEIKGETEIMISEIRPGAYTVRTREDKIGDVGKVIVSFDESKKRIDSMRIELSDVIAERDGKPLLGGRQWPVKSGDNILIGTDPLSPDFIIIVTDQEDLVTISLDK